jgi:prolycopene isomerase
LNSGSPGESYDVIVAGAGIGGLTAGALLAKAGKQVLVVEKEGRPGGWARALRHGAWQFEPAVHLIMGGSHVSPVGQGLLDAVLEHLQVKERCEFLRAEPFYRVRFPDVSMDVPTGREAFLDAHERHFPGSRPGLGALTELCAETFRESLSFPIRPRFSDWVLTPIRHPRIFRHANATLARVLDRHGDDPRVNTAYSALWPYLGLPPSRASFLAWAMMMASYIEEGAFFCRGGSESLADALVGALETCGGTLVVGRGVTRIRVENGRVQGVVLEDGQDIRAPLVISNIDVRQAFGELVGPGHAPRRYAHRLQGLEPSFSIVAMYVATDLDVNALGFPRRHCSTTDGTTTTSCDPRRSPGPPR